jgi:hypothetical protein
VRIRPFENWAFFAVDRDNHPVFANQRIAKARYESIG